MAIVLLASQIPASTTYYEIPQPTLEEKIAQVFPEDPETALKIARAESNLNRTAYNPERHYGCNGSYSIMQVACIHYEERGIYGNDRFNEDINLQIAREIYEKQGWRPWGVCHDGKVDCGLSTSS